MGTQLRAVLFHGLADHSRLAILRELEHVERRVGDLVSMSGLTQSNVSKHLACLWEWPRRAAPRARDYYRLVAGIAELLASADAVLAATGERVRACPRYGAHPREAA